MAHVACVRLLTCSGIINTTLQQVLDSITFRIRTILIPVRSLENPTCRVYNVSHSLFWRIPQKWRQLTRIVTSRLVCQYFSAQ